MSESGQVAAPQQLLGPNQSSTLEAIQAGPQVMALEDKDLALLRMSLCNAEASSTATALESMAVAKQLHESLILNAANYTLQPAEAAAVAGANNQAPLPLTKLTMDHIYEPMKLIDTKLDYYFSELWTQNGDERSSKLPFMSGGPWKLICATLVYLYLIKWLLPKIMLRFKALELNWLIRAYNLLMVLSNMYACYHGARILEFGTKSFGCEVINHRDYSTKAIELLHYGWLFFLSRLIEWLDTVFFVLRKKEKQVTKLHVFHHSFVPFICWTYLKFHPGYTVAFFPLVNTFVHSIMYTYYLLATFGPAIQPYLWWKKYLTSLQIAQFVLVLIQLTSIPLSTNEKCQYPRGFLCAAFAGAILFLWLFYTYYIDTYNKKAPNSQSTETNGRRALNNPKITYTREGSSRSLSDSIDNVLDSARDEMITTTRNKKANKLD